MRNIEALVNARAGGIPWNYAREPAAAAESVRRVHPPPMSQHPRPIATSCQPSCGLLGPMLPRTTHEQPNRKCVHRSLRFRISVLPVLAQEWQSRNASRSGSFIGRRLQSLRSRARGGTMSASHRTSLINAYVAPPGGISFIACHASTLSMTNSHVSAAVRQPGTQILPSFEGLRLLYEQSQAAGLHYGTALCDREQHVSAPRRPKAV